MGGGPWEELGSLGSHGGEPSAGSIIWPSYGHPPHLVYCLFFFWGCVGVAKNLFTRSSSYAGRLALKKEKVSGYQFPSNGSCLLRWQAKRPRPRDLWPVGFLCFSRVPDKSRLVPATSRPSGLLLGAAAAADGNRRRKTTIYYTTTTSHSNHIVLAYIVLYYRRIMFMRGVKQGSPLYYCWI